MKKIQAKFNSKCNETGKTLKKGDAIYYDPYEKKAYHPESNKVKNNIESESLGSYIRAQEEAMFERYGY